MGVWCADCIWGVTQYKREYKGVVIGCRNPESQLSMERCFVAKEEKAIDDGKKGKLESTTKNDLGVTSELENNSITLERKFGELKVRR